MASGSSLVVPLVMWGQEPPSHCISALYLMRDQRTLLTGSSDGQVFLWDVAEDEKGAWNMRPRHVLIGHTAAVRCISKASAGADGHLAVTSSDNGEMFLWDTVDGACLESRKFSHLVHTSIQSYKSPAARSGPHDASGPTAPSSSSAVSSSGGGAGSVRLFCCGFYEEVVVMDPFSLTVLFQLASRINPDWMAAFHVLRPRNRQDDVVLALTTTGTVKVWTLDGSETSSTEPVLENESKQIRCVNAVSMTCCVYNMRTVLVVCPTYWSIYDAGDFTCLLSVDCHRGERWVGGEFISSDRVAVWSDDGSGYLYRMPSNCVVESKDFHNRSRMASSVSGSSLIFCRLAASKATAKAAPPLDCPPAFRYVIMSKDQKWLKFLMRGDSNGKVAVWRIPDTPECASMQLRRDESLRQCPDGSAELEELRPATSVQLADIWRRLVPPPPGVLDQLMDPNSCIPEEDGPEARGLPGGEGQQQQQQHQRGPPILTATVFLASQCRLVCGREDGSIVIVPATQTVMLHLLAGRHQNFGPNWPQRQLLLGHDGSVSCLLYPHGENPRYDVAHLVSGSVDFSVCLWDVHTGSLLHRFSSHGGEITHLYVPPETCSVRVQACVCCVGSDHSVTLLSLKEKRCVMLASRHVFPVSTIKFRPLDDFLLVGCTDGTTYVWQMETGHLDRVVHGHAGEEILAACDENATTVNLGENVGANPALHFFRGLKHRNLAAIKLAAQSGISHLKEKQGPVDRIRERNRAYPLVVNGFRMNPKDAEGHILFFDVEALVVQLLTEEYGAMSPGTMEAQGFTNQREYDRVWGLTRPASPDTVKKISGFLNKVKDRADDKLSSLSQGASPETQRRLTGIMAKVKEGAEKAKGEIENAKRELEKRAGALDGEVAGGRKGSLSGAGDPTTGSSRPSALQLEINLTLEIGQLLLSLLHAWGLDPELDKVATNRLGLLRPKIPVSYGIMSRGGVLSLMLPTWKPDKAAGADVSNHHDVVVVPRPQRAKDAEETFYFTALGHWELSHTITTNHLLSIIAITKTLVSVSNATFIPEQERKRKLVRQATHGAMELSPAGAAVVGSGGGAGCGPGSSSGGGVPGSSSFVDPSAFTHQQEQIRTGWSLLSTLHGILMSNKLKALGSAAFRKPLVELLAIRWQDRCLQIRLAAQELLVAELKNFGVNGRRCLVEKWGSYLPKYGDPPFNQHGGGHPHHPSSLGLASSSSASLSTMGSSAGLSGQGQQQHPQGVPGGSANGGSATSPHGHQSMAGDEDDTEEDDEYMDEGNAATAAGGDISVSQSNIIEMRRNQTTAVILLGVIGALFDLEAETRGEPESAKALGNNLTRLTAKALMYLVLCSAKSAAVGQAGSQSVPSGGTGVVATPAAHPGASNSLQANNAGLNGSNAVGSPLGVHGAGGSGPAAGPGSTGSGGGPAASWAISKALNLSSAKSPLRRAAIDLIGRGFVLWEPHLEVSKVILGLLEMTCEADWWVPSSKYGLPLTPSGDLCRTSRHALAQIARVRPAVFITSVAREIARYNNLAANAQTLNINLAHHVLSRSKAEVLHLVEQLIDSKRAELVNLLVDVVDIVLHCVDPNHLKNRSMAEVFPPMCLFTQVSHCLPARRIAVGTRTGQLALYEMRSSKMQTVQAHSGPILAVSYSPEGKSLATFSATDNKLNFWQTSTGMFGLGNAQTKCTRTYNTPPPGFSNPLVVVEGQQHSTNGSGGPPAYTPKLVWISAKTVTLLLPDGAEHRFNAA